MTPQDWEFIGAGAGWGFGIAFVLLVLDGLYNLICWALHRKIRRKKKTSRRCGNTNRETGGHKGQQRESA